MDNPPPKNFSLYSWLLKKLRNKLILWYFFTFLSSFFYYQATSGGLKLWGYKDIDFPHHILFENVSISSRNSLLLYSFFCFFVGNLLTILVCEYLKNYSLELCRNYLRRLILNCSEKNSPRNRLEKREVLNNFLGEVELFTPLFILAPHKIFAAGINIVLTIVFLGSFSPDNLSIYFILLVSLIIAFLSFLAYQIQSRISQKNNQFRRRENNAMEKYLENQIESQEVKNLLKSNFQKTRQSFFKKTLSCLPNLIIPGLSILFCFVYSTNKNWAVTDFVRIGTLAASIQTIFWKVKDITDNLPEISKIKVHYNSLQKVISKTKAKKRTNFPDPIIQ